MTINVLATINYCKSYIITQNDIKRNEGENKKKLIKG
jgi:hypothetical protein